MADADVLPYDYVAYAREISATLKPPKRRAATLDLSSWTFSRCGGRRHALHRRRAGVYGLQTAASGDLARLNLALRQTETALLTEPALPNRPWFRHTIYAPGEFTGYSAVVIPASTRPSTPTIPRSPPSS